MRCKMLREQRKELNVKHKKFSLRRRQMMAIGTIGAGTLAVPAVVMAAQELEGAAMKNHAGAKIVVSGRIVGALDGEPLAGAQIEIWSADARGVRAESSRETVIADGDGRYFAAISSKAPRLHYRVSHRGYTASVTQMHAMGPRQRSVTVALDHEGTTRAAFEMTLMPRNAIASVTPDYVAL
jgi:protocatechuate 3,4-dioxygenase beta subunit